MKCVYQIRNKVNGWVYIGSTVNFFTRIRQHLESLKSGKHYNYKLQAAYKQFGATAFSIEVIYQGNDKTTRSELYDIEQKFLDSRGDKYNIRTEARDKINVNCIGIVCHPKFQKTVIKDIRYHTKIKGQMITTIKDADKIKANGGIVIRIKDKFLDKHHSAIMKYQFDYVIQNGNPANMVYKIENMLAKFGII